ncbi:unnamed protein product [Vitrella brassicaformis CCMP3155]|uniref:Glycosyltransferase 61 catalytic domain-containing protein n=2 Tax=Vitrella brassicaformis TaxID=1169539 RepID=A0A0G4FDC0_VITBC|nr:unnamed protein product [Vitrella brassicaformis CCMP3155]|eukprot:CEM11192.1 unnamed protein product [Vitrella brassicaformis CCMP3155]
MEWMLSMLNWQWQVFALILVSAAFLSLPSIPRYLLLRFRRPAEARETPRDDLTPERGCWNKTGPLIIAAFRELQLRVISPGPVPPWMSESGIHSRRVPQFDVSSVEDGVVDRGMVYTVKGAYVLGKHSVVFNCFSAVVFGRCRAHEAANGLTHDTLKSLVNGPVDQLSGSVVLLVAMWGDNYFHFLIENFMRLALVYDLLREDTSSRVLSHTNLKWSWRFFELLGIDSSRVIPYDKPCFFVERLIVPSATKCGHSRAPAVRLIRNLLIANIEKTLKLPMKTKPHILIQVRRKSRALSNLRALSARLRRSFPHVKVEYFRPKDSFEQAMRKHMQADVVIAPHGAGLSNMVFCAKGAEIIEIHAAIGNRGKGDMNHCYSDLAGVIGLRKWNLTSETIGNRRDGLTAPIEDVLRLVSARLYGS